MIKTILPILILNISFSFLASGQINASLMQHPDVSDKHICFVYGDDVWVCDITGGQAIRLSSPEGTESHPRFSPDGNTIAYTANYQGNSDVYTISVNGGIPKRLTFHGMFDRVLGWTPDGNSILFSSGRESGRQRYSQFYTVHKNGGMANKLPVPYGEFACFSDDGKKIAFTDRSRVNRNWKRYRGGTAPDIHIFNLTTYATENITNNNANDELPMWKGNSIYYMSDNGSEKRNNIWQYNIANKTHKQLTKFKNYDITFPEIGGNNIVFEAGGKLYLLNLDSNKSNEIKINVVSDQIAMMPKAQKVSKYIQNASISPDGKRIVVEARGDLFNLPATEGYVANITNSSSSAERSPAWSPDGKTLAYWSDASGEYQLTLKDLTKKSAGRKISDFKSGFNYDIHWSPDSKSIVYVDQTMSINLMNVETGEVTKIDKGKFMFEGNLRNFTASWSPDSRYISYSKSNGNRLSTAIYVYDTQDNKASQLTSGYYSDTQPCFSADGKYLFYTTGRSFQPVYSGVDNTFIYPNNTMVAVGSLEENTKSIIHVKNDAVELDDDDDKDDNDADEDEAGDEKEDDEDEAKESITFDVESFESRIELLDIDPGNLTRLMAVEGKLLFVRFPNSGTNGGSPTLHYYDIEEREVKSIIEEVGSYEPSAKGKKILVSQGNTLAVIDCAADQKIDKKVPTENMMMHVIPMEEWQQIFNDVWRFERDYFYDPNMHGVDWNDMKSRYGSLIKQCNTRNDVNIVLGDLIAELNASHTYTGGGDVEQADFINVGYLGADLSIDNGFYKIDKILQGATWDAEAKSALSKPGIDVNEGDFILAVNGMSIDASKDISASFQGLANETVELTVNSTPTLEEARQVVVQMMRSETRLRHLEWIESNRQRVDEASNGELGYIYVRSTGIDGQNELIRQFYAQLNKKGLVIDERFNSGGQIPDRFIELLDRKPLAFWAVRDGEDWAWPPAGNFGPKVMLINGFSGSGGDAFPDYFRKRNLGPLIGTRTWGGLIGITGGPNLVDNGAITMPTFRMYDPNGEWFKEGHGVDADIEVFEDFQKLANGSDVQLEAGIKEAMRQLKTGKYKIPERPKYEKR